MLHRRKISSNGTLPSAALRRQNMMAVFTMVASSYLRNTLSNPPASFYLQLAQASSSTTYSHRLLCQPNGRFETNKKICLSMSDYHPETWQPSWSSTYCSTDLLNDTCSCSLVWFIMILFAIPDHQLCSPYGACSSHQLFPNQGTRSCWRTRLL